MRLRSGFGLRLALIADLWMYLGVLVAFVLLPIYEPRDGSVNELTGKEIGLAVLALIPAYGLAGRLIARPHLPFNEWAYLVTAGYGMLVLTTFLVFGPAEVVVSVNDMKIAVGVTMIGFLGSWGAHVFDGTSKPLGPVVERWLRERDDVA